uniref:Ig-like domain-containing protein n=1 Tax=Chelonoidis abingdonii TaxID=106734 RepID=A0A8C0J7M1_CHEAB
VQISVPAQVEVLLGSLVTIPCTHSITGSPDTRLVEWFVTDRDGERRRVAYSEGGHGGVDQGTEYSGHVYMDPDLSLVLPKADVRDERAFSCQVTAGAAGSAEGVAQLRVYGERHLPMGLGKWGAVLGVISRNANPAPTISWFKDGARLEAPTERNDDMYVVSRSVKEASGLQSVSSTLYLRPSKADKDAQFQCLVQYPLPQGKVGNTTSERFSLVLHYFTENVEFMLESPLVIKEGDDVRLRCRGDGQPEPEYIFYRVQVLVVPSLGRGRTGVSRANSGTYRCQVLDFDSPPEVQLEKEVTIHVNYLDPLTLHPGRRVTVPLGGDVTLTCSGQGSQPPKLVWRKVRSTGRVAHGGTHTLHSVSYHVAGTYTCEASVPSVPGLQRDQTIQVTVEGTELSPGAQMWGVPPSWDRAWGDPLAWKCLRRGGNSKLDHSVYRGAFRTLWDRIDGADVGRCLQQVSVPGNPDLDRLLCPRCSLHLGAEEQECSTNGVSPGSSSGTGFDGPCGTGIDGADVVGAAEVSVRAESDLGRALWLRLQLAWKQQEQGNSIMALAGERFRHLDSRPLWDWIHGADAVRGRCRGCRRSDLWRALWLRCSWHESSRSRRLNHGPCR